MRIGRKRGRRKWFDRTPVLEAAIIAAAAIVLSLLYAGILSKGIFRATTSSATSPVPDAIPSIFLTFEEARELYESQRALFVDSRHTYDFSLGHIKGAINLPVRECEINHPILSVLPKNLTLVVYCDGEDCNSSPQLAKMMLASGFTKVKIFFGGWREWVAQKQPTEP